MADSYKIQLGIDFTGDKELNNIKKQLTTLTDNTHRVRIDIDNSRLLKQIEHAKKELRELSSAKGNQPSLTVNSKALEDSLGRLEKLIEGIKLSLGSLDNNVNTKDLVSSINQMATALGKAESESDSLVKSLSALSKKDFSVNIGIDLSKKGNNNMVAYGRAARKQVIPELESQIKELEGLFGGQQVVMQKLAKHGKNVGFDIFTDFEDFNSDSAIKKMEAMEKYIGSLKKLASIDNVSLDGFNSKFSKTATELIDDIAGVDTAVDKAGDIPEKLKNIFGSSVNADNLNIQLDDIVANLNDIKVALQGLSSGNPLSGLTQSFDRLSGSIENLLDNAEKVKGVLGGSVSNVDVGSTTDTKIKAENIVPDSSELTSSAQQVGKKIGDSIEQSVRETSGVIQNLKTTLETMKVDRSSIDTIIKDMEELGFVATDTSVKMKNGGFDITVNGVDSIGRAITEIRHLDTATDEISLVDRKISQSLKESDKFVKQQKRNVADLTNQINQLHRNANDQNAPKAIKNSSHLDILESKYKEIQLAIQKMGNASSDTYEEERINVKKLISEYQSLSRELRNAETVATSLRSKDIDTVKSTYASKLDVLTSKMKNDGVYTSGFEKGAENLRSVLSNATDASGLVSFLNGLDKLEAGYKRATAAKKEFNQSQKVGIKVSGLQDSIKNIQRISPEIDNFETEINGAKVSVQSLLNDLKQVRTQGDFSVVKENFRAFKEAAQAAGIAISETVAKVKNVNEIKIKLSDTGFDGFEQEVQRAHAEAEKLEYSTDELESALRELDVAMEAVYSADQSGDIKRLVSANEEYESSLKQVYSQLKLYQQEEEKAYKNELLSQKKASLNNDMEIWLKDNTRAVKNYGEEIRKLQASLDGLDDKGVKLVGQQFNNIKKQAQAMGKTGLTVFDKLKSKVKEYMTYFSAAELFMYAEQAFREMFNTVKEIDTAMTGLYRVTDLTSAEYDTLFNNMISSAKEYGATLNDIINATTDWVRAGFEADTALGLAEVTTMYQHISDLDYDTAAENLITAYNGFKDELNGAFSGDTVAAVNYIADIFNELDKQNCPLVV